MPNCRIWREIDRFRLVVLIGLAQKGANYVRFSVWFLNPGFYDNFDFREIRYLPADSSGSVFKSSLAASDLSSYVFGMRWLKLLRGDFFENRFLKDASPRWITHHKPLSCDDT